MREIQSGESIPSIPEMAKLLQISPNVVARSYKIVKQEQLIIHLRNDKFIVTHDVKFIQNRKQSTVKELCCSYISKMFELEFNKSEAVELMNSYCESIKCHN